MCLIHEWLPGDPAGHIHTQVTVGLGVLPSKEHHSCADQDSLNFSICGRYAAGAVIGRFTVLTAAHCVLSITDPGVTATSWKFAAGFNK